MDVFLVPVAPDRYELYCEEHDELTAGADAAPPRGFFRRMRVSYEDPEFIANAVFDRLVYGPHPYGRPQSGTPETLAAITRDDLVAFHRQWFGANNAILAIVGDVGAEEAFAGAERAFGKWGGAAAEPVKAADPPAPARRVIVIDKPGSVQTEIRVGNVAIARKNDDFMSDIYGNDTFRRATGSITGRVTKNGTGVLGAHIIAFNPATGKLIAGFSLSDDGTFVVAGLEPGPHVVRVEPLDDGDINSFLDPANVDINFKPAFYNKLVTVPRGSTAGSIELKVVPK